MDAIRVGLRVSLLLRRQHLALTDRMHRGVRVFPVLREGRDVYEMGVHFHGSGHVVGDDEQPPIRSHVRRGGRVQYRHRLLGTFDAIWVVPVHAPVACLNNQ